MPQETNLNISPYFDDFYDNERDYHKVLFKPGYPIQARELTTLQSTLQSQIERFGNHIFKEGSNVSGGQISYNDKLDYVILEDEYAGTNVESYLTFLNKSIIVGRTSRVRAEILFSMPRKISYLGNTTLFVRYLSPGNDEFEREKFLDSEILEVENSASGNPEGVVFGTIGSQLFLSAGEGFCTTKSTNSTGLASEVTLESGVFFIRGHFVKVGYSKVILDPYGNKGNFKVGLRVKENIINSDQDSNLNDNSSGFSNYTAPGADRFQVYAFLDKKDLNDNESNDFITLIEIRNGVQIATNDLPKYNDISQEFARRTFDESGNYYIKSPTVSVKETANDYRGNNGLFDEDSLTYNGNIAEESLGTYVISPLKAYVMGYELSTISETYLDFKKPRTLNTLKNQSVNYYTGPTFTLNRVTGAPKVGFSTYYVSLHLDRIGLDENSPGGKEIGLARVYDFALESGSYNTTSNSKSNEWDISLYDIQTYTEITLNEPINLSVPTQVKGNYSGAVGFLRYNVNDSNTITVYNIRGKFAIGETFSFDGIESSRISTSINSYGIEQVKSIYGSVGAAQTFTGDIKQSTLFDAGFVNISAEDIGVGISTVTSTDFIFSNSVKPDMIVSYTNPGNTVPTYSKIDSIVNSNTIKISAITSVDGICDGDLPNTNITPSNFKILQTKYQNSEDNTLYTKLPKSNISSVDLTNSNIIIRKEFEVTITSGSLSINSSKNESFLPFDEERYCLVTQNGITEQLTLDKVTLTNNSSTLTINGLDNDGPARLIATLRKVQVTPKVKNISKVNSLIVDKSIYEYSGTGESTIDDGLIYGNYPYGTRVQDNDICLNVANVTKILGIYESNDSLDPSIPSTVLSFISGESSNTNDLLIGEEFVGSNSNFRGILVEKSSVSEINYVQLSSNSLEIGETVTFLESKITAIISSTDSGDKNITNDYNFFNQQKDTIVDYSRITRKNTSKEPKRKLRIIFECSNISDSGDIVVANSYDQFDYCKIPQISGIRNTDIIDIRPIVSTYVPSENIPSPFEFLGRNISENKNSSNYILASDESFVIDYSYYLPRIDKIHLSKDGTFQLTSGKPSDNPQEPASIENCIEIASIYLPAYLCNIKDANIKLKQYKRYRMSDIKILEDRIKNLEYYTSLSVLESGTSSLEIVDDSGLNRFKSGFFVDDFYSKSSQKKSVFLKNSIDITNSELRPSHYSTEIDLLLGLNISPSEDKRFAENLIGSNIKRSGQILTLDFEEVAEIIQPYSSEVANVSAYSSGYYSGSIELFPSSDIWVDQVRLETKTYEAEGNYQRLSEDDDFDEQSGFAPSVWNSWETAWTGESINKTSEEVTQGYTVIRNDYESITKTGTSTRTGTRKILKEQLDNISFGDQVLNSTIVPYLRSRNIEFTGKRFKPFTKMYGFIDGVNINSYISPKLLRIRMLSEGGVFEVGETVTGYSTNTSDIISSNASSSSTFLDENGLCCTFRVAKSNHKFGEYNNPIEIYSRNPYNRNELIPETYTSTSSILNIDTYSLSNKVEGTYIGNPTVGTILRGENSGATAIVESVDLYTDEIGDIIGTIWIPNPNIDTNPKFETGTKVFRLTSNEVNSFIDGSFSSSAEQNFYAEGKINTVQENIISLRNAKIDTENLVETKESEEVGPNNLVNSTVIGYIQAPAPSYSPPAPSYSPPAIAAAAAVVVQPQPQPQPQPAATYPPTVINKGGPPMGQPAADRLNNILVTAGLPARATKGMSNEKARNLLRRANATNPEFFANVSFR